MSKVKHVKRENKIMLLVSVIFIIFSCSETKGPVKKQYIKMKNIQDVLTNLKPQYYTYECINSKDTSIECERGTILFIPANTFMFKDGSVPKGIIHLKIKECYDIASIIGEGLHTESQGNILESAGMIFIEAISDGKKLEIKKGHSIQLGFPKGEQEKEMDLFYFVNSPNGTPTWILDYKMFELGGGFEGANSESDMGEVMEYPIDVTDDMYDYFINCIGGNSASLDGIISGTTKNMWFYLNDQRNSKVAFAEDFYRNSYSFFIKFNIDKKGKMYNFRPVGNKDGYYSSDTPERSTKQAIQIYIDYLKTIPSFEISSFPDGITQGWDYSVGVEGYRGIDWQKFKKKFREQFEVTQKEFSNKFNKLDLDYYVFSVTELGWINCDLFLDLEEDQKTDFVVHVADNIDQKVRLIFDNNGGERTLMNGIDNKGKTVFKGVPKGQPVTIIGIGYNELNPTFAKGKTTISDQPFELRGFKKKTIEELEKEINSLN